MVLQSRRHEQRAAGFTSAQIPRPPNYSLIYAKCPQLRAIRSLLKCKRPLHWLSLQFRLSWCQLLQPRTCKKHVFKPDFSNHGTVLRALGRKSSRSLQDYGLQFWFSVPSQVWKDQAQHSTSQICTRYSGGLQR